MTVNDPVYIVIEHAMLNLPVFVGVNVMVLSLLSTTLSTLNAGIVTTLEHPGILLMFAIIFTGTSFLNVDGSSIYELPETRRVAV